VSTDAVREYYAAFGMREWQRLETAEGIVEFAVNTHFLDRFLPTTGRVLDLGGGPGRYAEWLAKRGLRVVLADASPELLEIARSRIASPLVEEIATADARDLSRWDNASFDAALLLGRCTTCQTRTIVEPPSVKLSGSLGLAGRCSLR